MGFCKDMGRARAASNDINRTLGRPTTTLGRIGTIGNDVRMAADQAEWAADQTARSQVVDGPVAGGLLGVGTLVSYRATGQMDGFQPISELVLDLEVDGLADQRVTAVVRVPYEALTLMTPGTRLRVSAHPQDPSHLSVDWSAGKV